MRGAVGWISVTLRMLSQREHPQRNLLTCLACGKGAFQAVSFWREERARLPPRCLMLRNSSPPAAYCSAK